MRIVINKNNFTPIVKLKNKYSLFFDVLPVQSVRENEELINCEVKDAPLSLTSEGAKNIIIKAIKERYAREIIGGFAYDDEHFITLSERDQANFSRLYGMSNLSSIYPLTMNIGQSEDQKTITVNNKDEFDSLMSAINNFIERKRSECRETLANIDWTLYEL